MAFPIWIKPALFGAAGGALALAVIGFSWGGWMTGGGAQTMANKQATAAVAAALVPFCLERSTLDPQAVTILAAMKEATGASRRAVLEKAGWATSPGAEKPNLEVAQACQLKLAEAF